MKIDLNQKQLNKIKNNLQHQHLREANNTYFFLENNGDIAEAGNRNSAIAKKRKSYCNYFDTFTDAYKQLKKLKKKSIKKYDLELQNDEISNDN
jgi:hypothetical protein